MAARVVAKGAAARAVARAVQAAVQGTRSDLLGFARIESSQGTVDS